LSPCLNPGGVVAQVFEHHVIARIGNKLFGLPLGISGPKGSFPTIAAATRVEKIVIGRY
jgi:hypothetical protein